MGYGIIRIAKRSSRAAVRGMLRHALREDAVPNAVPGAPRPQPLAGDGTSGAALARLSAAIKSAPRTRKDMVQALDILVTASHAEMLSWSKDQQDAFFRESLQFIGQRFGGPESILTAVVHRDETTPHMQVLIMPRDPATGAFQAVKMIGGPAGLRQMQDAFHAEIGAPRGLLRGEKGTHAEHVPIKRFYAQLAAADKPLPDYVAVPDRPTWPDRIAGRTAEIEARRKAALEHNERARRALVARAKAAEQIHPSQIARAAHTYRAAVHMEQLAKAAQAEAQREQQQARTAGDKARGIVDTARAEYKALEGRREALERSVEAGWHLGTVDAFSVTVTSEYRAMLARELGIELRPGRLVDQVRRGMGLRSGAQAVEAIERVALGRGHSFTGSAGEWAARTEYDSDAQQQP